MHPERGPVDLIAAKLRETLGDPPPTAIVLGSGLGLVAERLVLEKRASTADVGLPRSTVQGHAGELLTGTLGRSRVLLLSGRVHLYEGYPPAEVIRYVRALHAWGVQRLLLTCSAGGISRSLDPGDLLIVSDHINFQQVPTLLGEQWGDARFPDMCNAYDRGMRAALQEAALELGMVLKEGVYAATTGPGYETPAETRFLRVVGADAVGMSTVPEVLAAVQTGLTVAALAVISNPAADLSDRPLSHDEVTVTAGEAAKAVADLLERACSKF